MSGQAAQQAVNGMPGSQERGIQENIAAYENQAETERKHASSAEAKGQWGDFDYYMDLAGEYQQKANDSRYQMSGHHEKESKTSHTEPNQ